MRKIRIVENIIGILLFLNIVFYLINKEFLNSIFFSRIIDYAFWFFLGIFMGYQLCKIIIRKSIL